MATVMLTKVFEPLDLCRLYGSIPPDERPPRQEETVRRLLRPALAGLALSKLLQHSYDSTMRRRDFSVAGRLLGIDMIFLDDQPVTVVYHPKEVITDVLPDYRPGISPDWYKDESLVVRTRESQSRQSNFS